MKGSLDVLLAAIDKALPFPGRFRSRLPADVAELSRLLTAARNERERGYLNRPNLLSAYVRYFVPWNVFRLLKLFEHAGMPCVFSGGDAVIDLGSGPLTLPIALWIAFPELRRLNLEFRCIDRSAQALEAGKRIFAVLTGDQETPWNIKTIHDSLDAPVRGKKAKLVCAVNVFNETCRTGTENAQWAAALLDSLCESGGTILAVEPGNPQGGAFIAALRDALQKKGWPAAAPCPHHVSCPMPGVKRPGGKPKWCHFGFDTEEAPAALHKLSASAGLPKERAAFSFLLAHCRGLNAASAETMNIRIMSDPFPVGSGWGRYGCSEGGLTLVTGNKTDIIKTAPLSLVNLPRPMPGSERDRKTGALVISLYPRTRAQ